MNYGIRGFDLNFDGGVLDIGLDIDVRGIRIELEGVGWRLLLVYYFFLNIYR